MPNYTKIPDWFREEYKKKFLPLSDKEIQKQSETDPVIFAFYYLGQKLRLHQAYIIHKILTAKPKTKYLGVRIAMCVARQLGKSIGFVCFSVWACWYNKYPVTMFKQTIIYLTSRDDPAAEDVIKKIRKVLEMGNNHMTKYGETNYFTGSLKQPNNNHEITFLNDAYIGSFPPTLTSLGKSASWFFIDEAHRLNCTDTDPDTFFDTASSMVAETGGGIVLSSSPEGITGFFYKAIDPEKQNLNNEYESLWWSHEIWDEDTPECKAHKAYVESERIRLTEAGRIKVWQQEHLALFTVTETSFFDNQDIENATENTPEYYEWHYSPCSVGYDYGLTKSRTVITVRTVWQNRILQLFQYRCPAGFDINNLTNPEWEHSIQRLKLRYNLFMILPDDCPQGDQTNKWFKQNSGIEVKSYNFRSDQMSKTDGVNRNCAAYSYRAKLKEGILKIPKWNTMQKYEMNIVQEIEQKVLISIKSPEGQLCDTFDSDMMACIPFLDMQGTIGFEFDVPKDEVEEHKSKDPRYDYRHNLTEEECQDLLRRANEGEFID